jgi:hypothetical protein
MEPPFRKPLLYPAELRDHSCIFNNLAIRAIWPGTKQAPNKRELLGVPMCRRVAVARTLTDRATHLSRLRGVRRLAAEDNPETSRLSRVVIC